MGSLFAAHLARGSGETWACDKWREHVEAIKARGLRVVQGHSERSVALKATSDPTEPGIADVLIVFVKYNQTREALSVARPMVGPRTVLVTLQNGLGNVELLREAFPANRIFYGFTTLTSELLGAGTIEASYAGRGETCLWPVDGRADSEAEALRAMLEEGGIHATLAAEIDLMIWKKLIVNCCLNTLCAITGLSVGQLCAKPESWPTLDALADEIIGVAARKGIALGREPGHQFLRSVAEEARNHLPSMLVDVRHRRQTEIECLNGAVLREAARLGIDAPVNRTVYAIIRALESSFAG
jgi:2-dehydropantoate 2-reductase